MGAIGALIGRDPLDGDRLARSLAVSRHRGHRVRVEPLGRIAIGALSGDRDDAWCHRGQKWSVAIAGAVDLVDTEAHPRDPAAALARLLDEVGVGAVSRLRGDFAGVASDGHRLVAFRDHLGTDGLVVGGTGRLSAVMSEPKQVVAALSRARRPDVDALVAVYFAQTEAEDEVPCVVEGVERIPRSTLVDVSSEGWRPIGRVWDPSGLVETSTLSADEAKEEAWDLIERVVMRSVTDTTAVSLSGGIDSTVIAAAAAPVVRRQGRRLGSISAVYPHAPSVDESDYIAKTVDFLDLDSSIYVPTTPRLADLDQWVDRFDGPTYGLALGAVVDLNTAARARGYDVVLGGEMAELVYDLREHALARIIWRGRFDTALSHIAGLQERGLGLSQITRLILGGMVPSSMGRWYKERIKTVDLPAPWLDRSFMPGLNVSWGMRRPARRRWMDIQEHFAVGPTAPGLEVVNIMGDVAGVRTRRPLADRDLWDFFLSLPPEIKFPTADTKALVRKMLEGRAPEEVVWRRDKTVFNEDSFDKADFQWLHGRLSDGFRLPGVNYSVLLQRLESASLSMWELWMARTLASIHAFMGLET